MRYASHARKAVLLSLLVIGLVLMGGGILQERPALAIAGVGSWLLVLMALLWGMRFRLDQAGRVGEAVQSDLSRLRRSQLSMHSRVSTRLNEQRSRLDRMRESQLKLHSRIAIQGMSTARQQKVALEELRELLERSRQAGVDGLTLTLRAYREAHSAWTRAHALMEAQGERVDGVSKAVDMLAVAQQEYGSETREGVQHVLSSISISEDARDKCHGELKRELSALASSVLQESAEVSALATGIAEQLAAVERYSLDSGRDVAEAATSVRSLIDQLASVESTTALLSEHLRSGVSRQDELAAELNNAIVRLGEQLKALQDGSVAAEAEQRLGLLNQTSEAMTLLHAELEALRKQWMEGKTKLLNRSDQNRRELQQSMEAILQLEGLSLLRAPHPLMDGWAMDPVSVLGVLRIVLETRPGLVVECGSGTSTVWIAAALKQLGQGRLVSLEHLEEYALKTREALAAQGLEGIADVRCAPLTELTVDERAVQWYDPALFADLGQVDMLLVDGPPKSVGEHARHPAVPVLADKLHSGAIIIVDDCDRPDEVASIKRWQERMPQVGPTAVIGPRTLMLRWAQGAGGASHKNPG